MKVTKLVHSCLLVEKDGKKLLTDPGSYSWNSGLIESISLQNIDTVVVTHGHPDHLDEAFAREVLKRSPDAHWYAPAEVANQLSEWGIEAKTSSDDPNVKFIRSSHADLSPWFSQQPEHTSFVLLEELLIGGDCHTLTESHGARVFGGAISGGPWGAVVGFSKMIEAMTDRPKVVLPLHDWHFNDDARKGIYAHLPEVMEGFGIEFVALENGQAQEV